MVPAEGFEPPTFGLQNRCTTTVLSRRKMRLYNRIFRMFQLENYIFLFFLLNCESLP
jgi:hypothetical protein